MTSKRLVVSAVVSLVMTVGAVVWARLTVGNRPPPARVDIDRTVAPTALPASRSADGPHWADRAALRVARLSVLVSVIALGVAIVFALRPYPADPTRVPTFGTPQDWRPITSAADSHELFDFLRDNAGRKVRLYLGFDQNGPFDVAEPGELFVPGPDCPDKPDLSQFDCNWIKLQVDVSAGRTGLIFEHGAYVLRGYFANLGSIGIWTGVEVISITPLTAVEAVS